MKVGVFLEARGDSGQPEVGRCQRFSRELKEGARQPKTGRMDRQRVQEREHIYLSVL